MRRSRLGCQMISARFVFSLALLGLSASAKTAAQTFTAIADTLEGAYYSAVAWGDYDNDGDLDILATGLSAKGIQAKIYRNDSTHFVDANVALEGVEFGAVAWGDDDHDGDLDILLTGNSTVFGPIARGYRNESGSFVDLDAGLIGLSSSACAWGDYDNDGDLDILLAGFLPAQGPVAIIYRNDRNQFVDSQITLPGIYEGSVAWGDYDNDGDLDILLTGIDNASQHVSQIYRNDGGSFVDIGAPLTGVSSSAAAWGDYDNDGDLDLVLSGFSDAGEATEVYQNEAGNFTNINAALTGAYTGAVAWGDYDNDGDLDLLLTGRTFADTTHLAIVYQNDGGSFSDIAAGLIGLRESAAAWGDYDNDGDLDILLAGVNDKAGVFLKVYRNDGAKANTAPAVPANLVAYASGDSVFLNWDRSSDGETPRPGLTYNLRAGTTSGGSEIVAPMADRLSGYRQIPQLGNTNHDTLWTIKKLPEGFYYWSVQAIDHALAGSAFAEEAGFVIDLTPPTIVNVSAASIIDLGSSVSVSANATDNFGVQEVWLRYREGGKTMYDSTTMIFTITGFQAAIPGAIAGIRGIEYSIEVFDVAYNQSLSGWRPVQVKLPDKLLRKKHSGGLAQEAYRLISIPQTSDDPSVDSILLPDLGAPDTLEWRMWAINPQRATSLFPYIEYPAVGNFAPGKAKFLITREDKTLTSGTGVTVKTVDPFTIQLQPGWNMIASPFNFAIPIQNVRPENLQANLYAYNGSWKAAPDSLRPWEGYLIKVSGTTALTILPFEMITSPQSTIAKLVASPATKPRAESSAMTPDWLISIQATCERASDLDNAVGVMQDAAMEWDRHERFEPPPIGEFVMVSFPHRDWQQYADVYTTDFHPPAADGYAWDFTIDSNIPGTPVTLRFDNLESMPSELEVRLIDINLKIAQDLRRENQYVYRSNRDGGKKAFRLLVGKANYIVEHSAGVIVVPTTFELTQNFPNPFNPSTSIKFGLPEKSRVSLKIYNLLGNEIARLLNGEEKDSGYHAVIWEGKNQDGIAVPSGIYLYRLQAGPAVLTKKLTLIK